MTSSLTQQYQKTEAILANIECISAKN